MEFFEPIAIIGRGCVLPGCFSPDQLNSLLSIGGTAISQPISTDLNRQLEKAAEALKKVRSFNQGYIQEFYKIFNSLDYGFDTQLINQLDPLFHWSLYAAKKALLEARMLNAPIRQQTGLILGNLGFPSSSLCRLYENTILNACLPDLIQTDSINPYNRFMTGFPAILIKQVFGLGKRAFALDAACASSLYAVKYACDMLHQEAADAMLVGGVNGSDPTLLYISLAKLNALSVSGQSRPFNKETDGLVPGAGSAFIVLKRLEDAERNQDNILGIIRGIAISNNGADKSLNIPSQKEQVNCMQKALEIAQVDHQEVSYIECHAAGIAIQDAIEIRSMHQVYQHPESIPIGSIKANIGHLISVSGIASILKVISSFENHCLYPTPHVHPMLPEIDKFGFRLLDHLEHWPKEEQRSRIAAISTFGFGGNNAHLIMQEPQKTTGPIRRKKQEIPPCAIVGVRLHTNQTCQPADFLNLLLSKKIKHSKESLDEASFSFNQLPSPPHDLQNSSGQQLIMLQLALDLSKQIKQMDQERTAIFIGAENDPELCRITLQSNLKDLIEKNDHLFPSEAWLEEAKSQIISPPITSSTINGHMLNQIANKINKALHISGPGMTVMAEELSGDTALYLALLSLQNKEIDTAIVGAVDLCLNQFQEEISKETLPASHQTAGDGAVILLIKRLEDARQANDPILAIIHSTQEAGQASLIGNYSPDYSLSKSLGHTHAASGLLHITLAALMAYYRIEIEPSKSEWIPALPKFLNQTFSVENRSFSGESLTTYLQPFNDLRLNREGILPRPLIHTYAAHTIEELTMKLRDGLYNDKDKGSYRLAIVAMTEEQEPLRATAIHLLENRSIQEGWIHPKIVFRKTPVEGKLATCFTGGSAAYPGMARDLLLSFPGTIDYVKRRLHIPNEYFTICTWLFDPAKASCHDVEEELATSTLFCQIHADLILDLLGIHPDATLGLSVGEFNCLLATNVWNDISLIYEKTMSSRLYGQYFSGEFLLLKQFWGKENPDWQNWMVIAPVEEVQQVANRYEDAAVTIVYSPTRCFVSGEPETCKKLLAELKGAKARLMTNNLLIHTPLLKPITHMLNYVYDYPVYPRDDITFYAYTFKGPYTLTKENIITALTEQALKPIHFPTVIEAAWNDGVRIFLEHGAFNTLSVSIDEILQEKPHLSIPLDSPPFSSLTQLFKAVAELWTAGVTLQLDRLYPDSHLFSETHRLSAHSSILRFPLHPAPIQFPALDSLQNTRPSILWDRKDLETLAIGKVSSVFGPLFKQQDEYDLHVRVPAPPFLLCDRILSITGEPGNQKAGKICSETDLHPNSWFIHRNHMLAGPYIESGQAHLIIISWLGVDFINKGSRVYRLLGCTFTFYGHLPQVGDVLRHEISIDGSVKNKDMRIFFFHYDCFINGQLRQTVRSGQAGFFTPQELKESIGLIWDPETASYTNNPRLDPPKIKGKKSHFSPEEIEAFAQGDLIHCFGPDYQTSTFHDDTPRIAADKMNLMGEVVELDVEGGPAGRGYAKSLFQVDPDFWVFKSHFVHDPCFPATLMLEGLTQLASFYMTALGYTLDKDGWIFEPVPEIPYEGKLRVQCTPENKEICYELFVDEIIADPHPTLWVHVVARIDGVKAFLCEHYAIQLVPPP